MPLNGDVRLDDRNPTVAEALRHVLAGQHRLHTLLEESLARATASLDQTVFELDQGQPNTTGTNPGFRAQTNDIELIEGLLVVVPVGTTSATMSIGEQLVLPIQNTFTFLSCLNWVIKGQKRSLVYAPANATLGSTVLLWGKAAPGLVPGVLHP